MGEYPYGYHLAIFLLSLSIILINFITSPVLIQISVYSCLIVYSGSKSAIGNKKNLSDSNVFTKLDAFIFPILGSFVLLTIYFAYKVFGVYFINLLLSSYFAIIGCLSLTSLLYNIFHPLIKFKFTVEDEDSTEGKLNHNKGSVFLKLSVETVFFLIISLLIISTWVKTKHWMLHNIIAISFCIESIRYISIGNLVIGWILLWGFFIFDIFWIFGTNIMLTIAKTTEAPIKLFLPYTSSHKQFRMLGLGDIILPGLFISMVMKFDKYIESLQNRKTNHFWATLFSYQVGLSLAVYALNRFNTGQPALLYIVPTMTFGFLISVLISNDLPLALKFEDE